MTDAEKIAALEERIADLKKRNAALVAKADQQGRKIAMQADTISALQMQLDHANNF